MGELGDDIREESEAAELRGVVTRLQKQVARLQRREADLVDAVHRAAHDAALTVGTPAPIPRPKRDRRRHPEHAVLHLTDWQLGKVTESYDTDICAQRITRAVEKTIRITEMQRAARPVPVAHILLGGDLIENVTIFPGQAWEVDSTAFDQVFRASALVERVIVSLLEAFDEVHVWEVSGNHGRIGRKGDSPREDNLDRIVGRIARERLATQKRLVWEAPEGWYTHVTAGEYMRHPRARRSSEVVRRSDAGLWDSPQGDFLGVGCCPGIRRTMDGALPHADAAHSSERRHPAGHGEP